MTKFRVAFNVDLFMTLEAPDNADSYALEKLAKAAIREVFAAGDEPLPEVGIPVGCNSHDMLAYVRDDRGPAEIEGGQDDDRVVLENFTIEGVVGDEGGLHA